MLIRKSAMGLLLALMLTEIGVGAERYVNPVLHADFSDPDAIRVGEKYYMTASSFQCVPGLPILRSEDLVHWRLVNYALPRLPGASVPGTTVVVE